MDAEPHDSAATIVAIGLLAYASADVAHHAFGHAAACLTCGGSVQSLSSVFVKCSLSGALIDLAGPCANLALGLGAALVGRAMDCRRPATGMFWTLVASFNLLWFSLQLVFSVATGTDDWAWALRRLDVALPVRGVLIAAGALAYLRTLRFAAARMVPFARPLRRVRRIVLLVWITAGVTASATSALDHDALSATLHSALPQSLLLSIGLLWVPAMAARRPSPGRPAAALGFSVPWVLAAAVVGAASMLLLGPGIAVTL